MDTAFQSSYFNYDPHYQASPTRFFSEEVGYAQMSRPILQLSKCCLGASHAKRSWRASLDAIISSLKLHDCLFSDTHVESFFECQQAICVSLHAKLSQEISKLNRFFRRGLQERSPKVCVENIFQREQSFWIGQLSLPITAKSALAPPISYTALLKYWTPWRAKKQTRPALANLSSLLHFVKHLFTFEFGLWSEGSREILRKSRYSRSKFLQRVASSDVVNHTLPKRELSSVRRPYHSSGPLANFPDILEHLERCNRKEPPLSRKWKKLLAAMDEDLGEESRVDDQRRLNRLREEVFSYDTPTRNHSLTCREYIRTRYELSKKVSTYRNSNAPLSNLTSKDGRRMASSDQDSGDTLSLCGMSDGAGDAQCVGEKLGALFGSETEQKVYIDKSVLNTVETVERSTPTHGRHSHNNASVVRSDSEDLTDAADHHMNRIQNKNTSLEPLSDFICSPWSLKVAEFCIRKMRRGVVFLPPPLSSFPILALVVHSFISITLCDNRVLIVCESETDMASALQRYLNFLFDEHVSVEMIRRCQYARFPTQASLAKTLARIVILDSFNFAVTPGFSQLLILGPGTCSLSSLAHAPRGREYSIPNSTDSWAAIPSILILPYHTCNPVHNFLSRATKLATAFGIDEVLFIDDVDDVHLSVLLSRPDFIFLVPTRETLEIVSIFETHASSFFPIYNTAFDQVRIGSVYHCSIESLNDVKLDFLEECLSKKWVRASKEREAFEILFALKQARSYALHDGRQTAVDYLSHNIRTASQGAIVILEPLLFEIQEANNSELQLHDTPHPMAAALKKLLKMMQKQIINEAPSLRSVHRRERFRPMIISSSKENNDCLLKAIPGAYDVFDTSEGLVAICENRHVCTAESINPKASEHEKVVLKKLKEFSHVIHVLGDRTTATSCEPLPPELLENVHAGKTRLITVAVDESRTLEQLWRQNELLYSTMCDILRKATDLRMTKCKESYMLHTSLPWFTSRECRMLAEGKNPMSSEPINVGKSSDQTGWQEKRVHSTRHPRLLHTIHDETPNLCITPSVLCTHPIASLRSRLKGALREISEQPNHKRSLRVIVQVDVNERYTPAATYLFTALVGDEYLYRHVEVVFR